MSTIKKRSYVMVIGGQDRGDVAQVIDYLHDKSVFAIILNNNGYIRVVSSDKLRIATKDEKKNDKKRHNRELQLDQYQRAYLNKLRYD